MIDAITTRFAAWRRERDTVRELSRLTDRELTDLGIGRADIRFLAAGGSLDDVQPVSAPEARDAALIGPAWAAHVPTSLAA